MNSCNGEDAWSSYIRFVPRIKKPNKYVPPLQILRYPIEQPQLRFVRQQCLIASQQTTRTLPALFTRKQQKRFRPEARLDLHDSYKNIEEILLDFCTNCIVKNIKYILIITGKGRGIIKENTIVWLQTHNNFVIKYFEITDSSNACGSIGVHLRGAK